MNQALTELDVDAFNQEMAERSKGSAVSAMSGVGSHMSQLSMMSNRFDDSEVKDTDVVLTTKKCDQVKILLGQLVNSSTFRESNFDMTKSTYFNKHWDDTFVEQGKANESHHSVLDMVDSMPSRSCPSEDHFESNAPGTSAMDSALQSTQLKADSMPQHQDSQLNQAAEMDNLPETEANEQDEVLHEDEVDEEMFIFPNKQAEAEEEKEKEEFLNALSKTQDLLAPFIARNLD